ncbi:MAG: ribonuclease R [Nitrospirota bacterium]
MRARRRVQDRPRPRGNHLITGLLQGHPDGYGFVIPDEDPALGRRDVYIPARDMGAAMHGDRVEALVETRPAPRGRARPRTEERRQGRIVRVVERARREVVGRLARGPSFLFVVPTDPRISRDVAIPTAELHGAREGDLVVAEITACPEARQGFLGRVVRVLGQSGDPALDTDMVVAEFDLPREFPSEVEREAAAIPDRLTPGLLAGRRDLRALTTVTIDGEHAKDFDDAVSIDPLPDGGFRLWVHIADVSAYVAWDSPLDQEARRRGTSVYFPDRVVPMFPERLSNGLCSLNPGEDRLTLTCEMTFDADGHRAAYTLYPSVIISDERMTYTTVGRILEQDDPELSRRYASLLPMFRTMRALCERLSRRRRERGSIDFDLPEPEILLDVLGETTAIVKHDRTIAHRIIEEFMLAANETVAHHLDRLRIPSVYRVHERPDPDKLLNFAQVASGFGHRVALGDPVHPKPLARAVEAVRGRPEEALLNTLLLRSMKQARYAVENTGHFGLAATHYTHFTSPIRRYPDLVIHRLVRAALAGGGLSTERLEALLPEIALWSSTRERLAMEAEREVVDLKKARFMANKVGEEFAGIISGVTAYGFFVQLADVFVEGLVRAETIGGDFYVHDDARHALVGRKTRRVFRLGDPVRITVDRVDLIRRQVDFRLADPPDDAPTPGPHARQKPARKPRRTRS